MSLTEYKRKRDFRATPEPKGIVDPKQGWLYVIQKHDASHLHYDFRLELDGVLKSWAVPKGPSLNPATKRLAVQVEDHPVEYGGFEGIIPQGQYGGGTVMLWDRGDWTPVGDPQTAYKKGRLKFTLNGSKLRGGWMLVRKGGERDPDERTWFLIKERDDQASDDDEIVETAPRSVLSDRSIDEIADDSDRVWDSHRKNGHASAKKAKTSRGAGTKKKKSTSARRMEITEGRKTESVPTTIVPQLATLVDQPPGGDEWLNEIKFDGYRMICRIEKGSAKFFSRNLQDWTGKLSQLAEIAASFPVDDAILDGEVVALDSEGVSRFQLLQNAFRDGRSQSLHYYVFDLLHLNGRDLTKVPLERRKELLAELIGSVDDVSQIHLSEHVIGNGAEFFAQARKLKLEGIISKRRNGVYSSGRSREWLKTKCFAREEFVIGGYTDPGGSRSGFGALLIGYHGKGDKLMYAGKVGTGYTETTLKTVLEKLEPLGVARSPFTDFPTGRGSTKSTHWVRPKLVAQIEFSNWTDDGKLRHPAFLGLREDKPADDVVRDVPASTKSVEKEMKKTTKRAVKSSATDETTNTNPKTKKSLSAKKSTTSMKAGKSSDQESSSDATSAEELEKVSGIHLTHPDKIVYPELGLTKLDVARYYASVAKWILPQIKNRLAVLVRCPEGAAKECFYQKHPGAGTPDSLRQIAVKEKSSSGNYLVIEDLKGLVWLAQAGALELHVWGSQADDLERPDRLVFDLDPDPAVEWKRVVESAFQIRQFLQDLDLESFLKTTGGKGLHLVVPIQRRNDWDEVKDFCHAVATSIETADPSRYVSKMTKSARQGKIYVDYLRNQRGATSVAAYSTRARAGATVSTPITWDELRDGVHADQFNIMNIGERLTSLKEDPWKDISSTRQSITASARKAVGLK